MEPLRDPKKSSPDYPIIWTLDQIDQDFITRTISNLNRQATMERNIPARDSNAVTAQRVLSTHNETDDHDEPNPADISLLNKLLCEQLSENYESKDLEDTHLVPSNRSKDFCCYNIPQKVLQGLRVMGIRCPSRIQALVLDEIENNPTIPFKILAQGRSGSGKTIGFAVSALKVIDPFDGNTQFICLAPTIELVHQIAQVIRNVTKFMETIGVVEVRRGALSQELDQKRQIVIGTTGGIQELIVANVIRWEHLKCFVLDEGDVMLALEGHFEICLALIANLPRPCNVMFTSATFSQAIIDLASGLPTCKNCLKIFTLDMPVVLNREIQHFFTVCESRDDKLRKLIRIFSSLIICKCIIFCRTKWSAIFIRDLFAQAGATGVGVLTGANSVEERVQILRLFKQSQFRVLITTNVLSRGIDIDGINLVINYDVPVVIGKPNIVDGDTYVHRTGRTARFNKKGIVVNLLDSQNDIALIRQLEESYDLKIKQIDLKPFIENTQTIMH